MRAIAIDEARSQYWLGWASLVLAAMMRARDRATVVVVLLLLTGATSAAQEVRPIGSFDNVRISNATGEAHCYGYSVELWAYDGGVVGLLDVEDGLCGDPPCGAMRDVTFDARTGHLQFRTTITAMPFEFAGELRRQRVEGILNGKRVRLRRAANAPMNVDPRPETLASWCRFWISVPRCGGVRELCESLGLRP